MFCRKSQSFLPKVSLKNLCAEVPGRVTVDSSVYVGEEPKLWVKLCLLRSQFLLNTLPHTEQWYGLMSVCVRRCVLRLERWLKLRLHTGHLWGDSSMWRILCTANVRDWQKPFPHSPHLKGFSLLWMYLKHNDTFQTRHFSSGRK